MLTMYQQITIQTLHKQGKNKSEIAKLLGCHRHTVRKILNRETIAEKQTRKKSSMFDPYKQQIAAWQKADISRFRIYEKLQEELKLHCSYINICKYMQKHFPKSVEAFGVQLPPSGEEAELDFGFLGKLPGPNGKVVKTWGLAVVLAYSRVGYYAICYDQTLPTLVTQLKNAFAYFGGVPKKLKVDNMKTAVVKNQRYELEFNEDFLTFAQHYNTVVVPCTPYSPEQKGKVESGIKYLQQNFISGREFTDDRDIAAQLKNWMVNTANQRVHGTTKKVPWVELLETERKALQPLPMEEYSLFERCIRKVGLNCHIHFENNYYSVPYQHVNREVTVRFNTHLVRIILDGEQLTLHTRSTGSGEYVTVREHLPEHKIYSDTERQAQVEKQMREIGEHAHEYFRMLLQTRPGYWARTTRGIQGLCSKYGNEAVNLSLKRALYYHASDVPTIRRILEQKLYLLEPEPLLPKNAEEEPTMARNLGYYGVIYDANIVPATA